LEEEIFPLRIFFMYEIRIRRGDPEYDFPKGEPE
jgi:hypothetical protein